MAESRAVRVVPVDIGCMACLYEKRILQTSDVWMMGFQLGMFAPEIGLCVAHEHRFGQLHAEVQAELAGLMKGTDR